VTTPAARTLRPGVALALGLVLHAGCGPVDEPAPTPTPSGTGALPVAQIGALVPAEPGANDLEDTPAVQTIRETSTVLAWANLTDDAGFAQVTQWIDPKSRPALVGLSTAVERDPYVRTGPMPFVALGVVDNADGSTTVRTCSRMTDLAYITKADGSPRGNIRDRGGLSDITVSPLTTDEIADLEAVGLTAPALRVRSYQAVSGGCDASGVVVQQFENWRDVAPVGRYRHP
jgi:hypothetical protein